MARNNRKKTGVQTAPQSSMIRLTKRVVSSKRHTQGYMAGSRYITTSEARRLASAGRIAGVRVVGNHIQSEIGRRRLSDLPTQVMRADG